MSKYLKEFQKRLNFDKSESDSNWIIGIDEVGQGCFAGPIVVGAVLIDLNIFSEEVLKTYPEIIRIKDSKKLPPKARKLIEEDLKKLAYHPEFIYSIAEASVSEINELGLSKAHDLATERALAKIKESDFYKNNKPVIIIDGNKIDPCLKSEKVKCIVKADNKSLAVGCASILAKEYRDRLMNQLSELYSNYKWNENKGYGTEYHRQVIKVQGITEHHRIKFCRKFI